MVHGKHLMQCLENTSLPGGACLTPGDSQTPWIELFLPDSELSVTTCVFMWPLGERPSSPLDYKLLEGRHLNVTERGFD